jgi:hypothetical protein
MYWQVVMVPWPRDWFPGTGFQFALNAWSLDQAAQARCAALVWRAGTGGEAGQNSVIDQPFLSFLSLIGRQPTTPPCFSPQISPHTVPDRAAYNDEIEARNASVCPPCLPLLDQALLELKEKS